MVTPVGYNAYIRQLWATRPLAPLTFPRTLPTASLVQLRTHRLQQQIQSNFPTALKEINDSFTSAATTAKTLMKMFSATDASSLSAASPHAETKNTIKSLANQAQDFTQQYNAIVEKISAHNEMVNTDMLAPLFSFLEENPDQLKKSGFSINTNHTLTLNVETFENALSQQPETTLHTLSSPNSFVAQVIQQSKIVNSTALSTLMKTGPEVTNTKNPMIRQQLNQYRTMSNMNLYYANMYACGGFFSAQS